MSDLLTQNEKKIVAKCDPEAMGHAWLLLNEGKSVSQAIGGATLSLRNRTRRMFSDLETSGNIEGISAVNLSDDPKSIEILAPAIKANLPEWQAIQFDDYLNGIGLADNKDTRRRRENELIAAIHRLLIDKPQIMELLK